MPRDSATCKRSDTILLIKNLPYTVKETELKEVFDRYGSIVRFMMSPFNTLAIVEYAKSGQAIAAMKNLAYYKINYLTPIYLEYAPVGFIKENKPSKKAAKVEFLESDSESESASDND